MKIMNYIFVVYLIILWVIYLNYDIVVFLFIFKLIFDIF